VTTTLPWLFGQAVGAVEDLDGMEDALAGALLELERAGAAFAQPVADFEAA